MGGNEKKGIDSPRPTQIAIEQEEEADTQESVQNIKHEEETVAGNGKEDIGSSWPTQIIIEQIILVDAFTQTELPSISDACT